MIALFEPLDPELAPGGCLSRERILVQTRESCTRRPRVVPSSNHRIPDPPKPVPTVPQPVPPIVAIIAASLAGKNTNCKQIGGTELLGLWRFSSFRQFQWCEQRPRHVGLNPGIIVAVPIRSRTANSPAKSAYIRQHFDSWAILPTPDILSSPPIPFAAAARSPAGRPKTELDMLKRVASTFSRIALLTLAVVTFANGCTQAKVDTKTAPETGRARRGRRHPLDSARCPVRQPEARPGPAQPRRKMDQLSGAGRWRAEHLGRAGRRPVESQGGHEEKGPPDPSLQLGLRQQAHPLRARQERRRELPSLRDRRRHAAKRKTSRRSKASAPRLQEVSEKFPNEILVGLNDRDPRFTTSGGSTSRRARRNSCRKPWHRWLRHRRRLQRPARDGLHADRRPGDLQFRKRKATRSKWKDLHRIRSRRRHDQRPGRLRQDRPDALPRRQPQPQHGRPVRDGPQDGRARS